MNRRQFCKTAIASAVTASMPMTWARNVSKDYKGITGNGEETVLKSEDLEQLRNSLRGGMLLPTDDSYEQVRQLWNPMIDKRPAVIARCTGAADVKAAVDFARHYQLLTAVRCGGHNVAGKATCDDGIMIDLQPLQGIKVNPRDRTAYVAGGSLLGSMDHETMAHGLVTTAGTVSHTGVGGLTLGGGFGRVARRFGLASDNIKGLDVVTADGHIVHASKTENPDLHWACQGGGGNFGVVTGFEFQLHPMRRQVVGGRLIYPFERVRELIELYGEFSTNAPDEIYVDMVVIAPPQGGDRVVLFSVCYTGPVEKAEIALKPLLDAKPINNGLKTTDYVALQRSGDNTDPRLINRYTKGGFTREINNELARTLAEYFEPHPNRTGVVVFQHAGGAITRPAPEATAFAHRYANHNMFVSASWPHESKTDEHRQWAKNYWAALKPYAGGFYVNDILDETQKEINANYLGNYDRLVEVKNKYDPSNLFRLNANIVPTV